MEILEAKKQRLNLLMKPSLYEQLKQEAIINNTSVTRIINDLVEDHIYREPGEPGEDLDQEVKYYTINELEEMLKITRKTLISYINNGKLKAYKIGKNYRVAASDLKIFLDENKAR